MKYVFKIRAENKGYLYIVAESLTEAVACFDKLMRPDLPHEVEKLGIAHMALPVEVSS